MWHRALQLNQAIVCQMLHRMKYVGYSIYIRPHAKHEKHVYIGMRGRMVDVYPM